MVAYSQVANKYDMASKCTNLHVIEQNLTFDISSNVTTSLHAILLMKKTWNLGSFFTTYDTLRQRCQGNNGS